jgi:hypothetical protein
MSRTLSMNCGSGDSLKLSARWGLSPNARQIFDTVVWDIPAAFAIDRVDQCVASAGASCSVLTITRSTSASLTVRGAPGRGSSHRPSRRNSTNRRRHLPTVFSCTPRRPATSRLVAPPAQANTIRQRAASALALFGRRDQRCSTSRSSSLNMIGSVGRPRRAIATSIVADNDKNANPHTKIPTNKKLGTLDLRTVEPTWHHLLAHGDFVGLPEVMA